MINAMVTRPGVGYGDFMNMDGAQVKNADNDISLIMVNQDMLEEKGSRADMDKYDKAESLYHEIMAHVELAQGSAEAEHARYGATYGGTIYQRTPVGTPANAILTQLRILKNIDKVGNSLPAIMQRDNTKVGSGLGF